MTEKSEHIIRQEHFVAGVETEQERILALLDSRVCWECAQTRPTHAHTACSTFDEAIALIKGDPDA
jgi:hypothetical protein